MRKISVFTAIILCVALLLTLTSCKEYLVEDMQTFSEDALASYQQAREAVENAADLVVQTQYHCSRTVDGEIFTEDFTETATYCGLNTEDAKASVVQQVSFGPYKTQYEEHYYNGAAYCQTEDSTFRAQITFAQFADRQIPAVLVDTALYNTVSVDKLSGETVITFSEPTALESWVTDYVGAVLVSATAAVTLNKSGELVGASYTAQYTCSAVTYNLQVKTVISLQLPQNLEDKLSKIDTDCPTLTYLDAPRKILQVVGDVYTATAMTVRYKESVYSAAFSRSRTQASFYDLYGSGDDFMAQSRYKVVNTDYSNTPVSNAETVVFYDGVCLSSVNGAEPSVREGITAEAMRTFCEDAVLAALFTPNHLADAKLTANEDQLRIDFSGKTAFADNLCNSIYSIFNANLDSYAQSYTTPTAGGYLCIDRASGLPTALGVRLERVHVAGEVSYPLTYQLDQAMQLSSAAAYENIVSQILQQETTPTEPATNP